MDDELALINDIALMDAFEEESDPNTRELLGNELHWRALAYCSAQEVN